MRVASISLGTKHSELVSARLINRMNGTAYHSALDEMSILALKALSRAGYCIFCADLDLGLCEPGVLEHTL